MAASNVSPRVWEMGGILELSWAGNTLTVANVKPGTIRIKRPFKAPIHFKDRGVSQAPLTGSEELGEISFELHAVKYEANALYNVLNTQPTTAATAQEGSITIKVPDYAGAATGTTYVSTTASLAEGMEYQAGDGRDTDTLRARFMCRTMADAASY